MAFDFNLPEHPDYRVICAVPHPVRVNTVRVIRQSNDASRQLFEVLTDITCLRNMTLWRGDDYDTQEAGAGFTEATITARIIELLPSL